MNSIPWSFCFYGAHGRGLLLQGSLPCLDLVASHLCWRYALLDARCDSPSGRAPGRSPSWRRRLWNLGLALYLRGHSWGCLKCFWGTSHRWPSHLPSDSLVSWYSWPPRSFDRGSSGNARSSWNSWRDCSHWSWSGAYSGAEDSPS